MTRKNATLAMTRKNATFAMTGKDAPPAMTEKKKRALPSIRYDMEKETGEISEPSDDDSAVKPGPHAHVATGDVPFRMIIALGGRMHGGCVPFRDDVRRNARSEEHTSELQ